MSTRLTNATLQNMPSPRGTNFERLFVLKGHTPSPVAAYDSRRGLGLGRDGYTVGGGEPYSAATYSTEPNSGGIAPPSAAVDPGSMYQPQEDAAPGGNVAEIVSWAKSNLQPAEITQLISALQGISSPPRGQAGDSRQGRRREMSRAEVASYAARFPGGAKILGLR